MGAVSNSETLDLSYPILRNSPIDSCLRLIVVVMVCALPESKGDCGYGLYFTCIQGRLIMVVMVCTVPEAKVDIT